MASSSNINGSSGISAGDRAPRPPVIRRAPGPAALTQSSMWKMDVAEEIHWGRRKYKACLKRYEHYYNMPSEANVPKFIRNMAQQLIKSAFKHLNPGEELLKRMCWRIEVVIGGQRTEVKGYPGGGLMVIAGYKKLLVDWPEEEVAVRLASAIVDILLQSDAEKYLRARALDDYKLIPQVLKPYLTKLSSLMWERERVFLKDQMILLTLEGAGYDRQSMFDWYGKVQLPPFKKFLQPSLQYRARRLRAWSAEAKAPTTSQDESPAATTPIRGPRWFPTGKRIDDMSPDDLQYYKSILPTARYLYRRIQAPSSHTLANLKKYLCT